MYGIFICTRGVSLFRHSFVFKMRYQLNKNILLEEHAFKKARQLKTQKRKVWQILISSPLKVYHFECVTGLLITAALLTCACTKQPFMPIVQSPLTSPHIHVTFFCILGKLNSNVYQLIFKKLKIGLKFVSDLLE